MMAGPLSGLRIVEFGAIGPCPFAGMMLADHGAEVIRIEPLSKTVDLTDPLNRSRSFLHLDLKSEQGALRARELVLSSDGLIEGYRPGVMEKLGFCPHQLLRDKPNLVYGRMTGWGQDGPMAAVAGHDINFIGLSGILHMIGRAGDKPLPPVNLIGDYGGGGMLLALGMVSALLAVQRGAAGQVVDCAMVDGSALLGASAFAKHAGGRWTDDRGVNLLDSGAPFYDTYECSDGRYVAIGALEEKFFSNLVACLGLSDDPYFVDQYNRATWDGMRVRLADLLKTRSRDEWCDALRGVDACFGPVLSLEEASQSSHANARDGFIQLSGVVQPAPAPRYSLTPLQRPFLGQRLQ